MKLIYVVMRLWRHCFVRRQEEVWKANNPLILKPTNQIPHEAKIKLSEHIQNLGEERDVFHLYNNMWDLDLHLDYYVDGIGHRETLAETDGQGRWFVEAMISTYGTR
jgi:hypothetical protein